VTTNSTSDPASGTGGEPAKPTRARKPPAAKAAAAKAGDKPATTRTRAAAKPKAAAANGDAPTAAGTAKPAAKPAAKRAPAKSRAKASDTPVVGGAVDTPLAPDTPTEVAPVEVTPAVEAAPPSPPPGPSNDDYEKLIGGDTHDPHGILGAHPQGDGTTIVRTLRHHAQSVTLLQDGKEIPFESTYGGVFSAVIDGPVSDYRVRVDYGPGAVYEVDDPYRWLPTLGEMDLYLIGEGRHENLWDVLGAHVRTYETPGGPVTGTSFAVWAPNARGVRVTGDFDHWSGAGTPMRSLGSSGVWELFVPGVGEGTRYKFQILGQDGVWREKADPMAFYSEVPPATASVVSVAKHEWNDADWMSTRAVTDQLNGPLSIYEIHAGSWKMGLNYREMADELIAELADTGFTHVEFLPLAGHPFAPSWGYQVTSYYAPDSRFGGPDDLRYLIDRLHQAGIGVILDWVPAHFPKDEWALGRFDGTSLYEHADPRRGEQPDWARSSSTSVAARSATSWSPMRCTGWSSTTSTVCGWMPSPPCCIWTTPARRVSGCRTSTAATRIWTRWRSCRRPTPPSASASPVC